MSASTTLERQALCPHESQSKEIIMGQKTGDLVCNECGETFMRGEKVYRPEERDSIIASIHALRIARRANPDLQLKEDYEKKYIGVYDWALVDLKREIVIPVMAAVIDEAIRIGVLQRKE